MTFSGFAHRNIHSGFHAFKWATTTKMSHYDFRKYEERLPVSDEMQRVKRTYEASACFLTAEEGKAELLKGAYQGSAQMSTPPLFPIKTRYIGRNSWMWTTCSVFIPAVQAAGIGGTL